LITVKWSAPTRKRQSAPRSLKQSQALALAFAEHVRMRVRDHGRCVNDKGTRVPFKYDSKEYGPKNQRRPFFVNSVYAAAAGVDPRSGPFESSADFHKKAKAPPGAFSVTGGMWEGLSIIDQRGRRSKIYFGRSSLGMRSKSTGLTKTGKKRKPRKVRNRLKARSVGNKGIHVLMWTRLEIDSLLLALTEEIKLEAAANFVGMKWGQWSGFIVDRRLYRNARRYIDVASK